MERELLSIQGLHVRLASGSALRDFHMLIRADCLHGILGLRHAGKRTLARVLTGWIQPDGGSIRLYGRELRSGDPQMMRNAGIRYVTPSEGLISTMTVAENILVASPGVHRQLIREKQQIARCDAMFRQFGVSINSRLAAKQLTIRQNLIVQLVKAWRECAVCAIVDCTDRTLGDADNAALLTIFRQLCASGMAIVLLLERPDVLLHHCRHAIVLREGQNVFDIPAHYPHSSLLTILSGTPVVGHVIEKRTPDNTIYMRAERVPSAAGTVSFIVYRGEILGLLDPLNDSDMQPLRYLSGDNPLPPSARITVADQLLSPNHGLRDALRARVGLLDDLSVRRQLLPMLTPLQNATILAQQLQQPLSYERIEQGREAVGLADSMLRARSLSDLDHLSCLRIILLRWYLCDPIVLLCYRPFSHSDILHQNILIDYLSLMRARGTAFVILSPSAQELRRCCDRIQVLNTETVYELPDIER